MTAAMHCWSTAVDGMIDDSRNLPKWGYEGTTRWLYLSKRSPFVLAGVDR